MDVGKQVKLLRVHWYLHADLPIHTDRDASAATSTVLGARDIVSNMLPVDDNLVIPVPILEKGGSLSQLHWRLLLSIRFAIWWIVTHVLLIATPTGL